MINIRKGFTLIELIVVITILAILWTIAFISLQWYSRDARNSVRIGDLWLIKKSLELSFLDRSLYPTPDDAVDVTYSWATLWYQWYFWNNVYRINKNLSKRAVDPLFDIDYTYSTIKNLKQYQIWAMIEDESFWLNMDKTYAVTNSNMTSYVWWNFDFLDITWKVWNNCFNVTTPSIIVNNLPVDWKLLVWWNYNFVFNNSVNLPSNYESVIDIVGSPQGFNISEVYNKCSIDSLVDLSSYISDLSVSYQQYNFAKDFDQVVFSSDTLPFKLNAITNLKKNWISVPDSIIDDIYFAADYNVFIDTFSWNDADELVWEHSPDSLWNWNILDTWLATSYIINSNTLSKWNSSTDSVYSEPSVPITSPDSLTAFEIKDFNWGNISIYSRYADSDNYYLLNISATWYQISKKVSWTVTSFSNISEIISPNSIIKFAVFWNSIRLLINNIEKENIIDNSISNVWKNVLKISAQDASIDNYILLYK